jgi:glycosyltransferase involved in cell wall biosynthesis
MSDGLNIVHFQRKPYGAAFSVEGLFDNLRAEMNRQEVFPSVKVLPWYSKGLWNRIRSVAWARDHQGGVNHITGDVHFLAMGMDRHKTILTVLDLEMLKRLKGIKRFIVKLFWFELPFRNCKVVTVISEATRQEILRLIKFRPPQIDVIPCVIDNQYQPHQREFNRDCPQVLQIGSGHNKNIERLAAAMEGMKMDLHIVGRLSSSQEKCLSDHHIQYSNSVGLSNAELLLAYQNSDLLSFVSTEEGFGMPILEAQSVERAVITSNCSSMPEVAGDGALFVDPYDVDSIRNGLKRIVTDDVFRNQLVEKGRLNRARFSIEEVAAKYIALYRSI